MCSRSKSSRASVRSGSESPRSSHWVSISRRASSNAPLLGEETDQQVAEIRGLGTTSNDRPREDRFGLGEGSQPDHQAGALQGDATRQGRWLGGPRPGGQGRFRLIARQLATAELERDRSVPRPSLGEPQEAMPGQAQQARLAIMPGTGQFGAQSLRGPGPNAHARQDDRGREQDATDRESPKSHASDLHGNDACRSTLGPVPVPGRPMRTELPEGPGGDWRAAPAVIG